MATPPTLDGSALEGADGPATALPGDLRDLVATAPRRQRAALERLWGRLCHQGSVYAASVAAVPHLLEIASTPRTKGRDGIVELLAGIAVGDHANFFDGALAAARRKTTRRRGVTAKTVEARCYAAVAAGAPTLRTLLHDREAPVRAAAAFALAWLPDPVSSKAIAARCPEEPDAAARASMLIALGHLGATTRRAMLEAALNEGTATTAARTAAAIGLAYLDSKKLPATARQVLEAACVARALRKTRQPWNGGDLAGHAAAVLATLPARTKGRAEAIARLNVVAYLPGDKLAGELVRKVFSGRGAKSAASLTAIQRDLLATILRAGLVRVQGHVEAALRLRGLPPLRDLPRFVGVEAGVHRELRRRQEMRPRSLGRGATMALFTMAPYQPPPPPYREVWENRPDGRALCALIHGELGWLMWMDVPSSISYGSRNPVYDGTEEAVIDYILSNGQLDECPASWALPIETLERALDYFRQTGERAPFVEWEPD